MKDKYNTNKRAKKVDLRFKEHKTHSCVYDCPHCHTEIHEPGTMGNVIRFRCSYCLGELIINNIK